MFSTKLACPDHGISIEELEPRMFFVQRAVRRLSDSHNGLGFTQKLDQKLLIDETKSIDEGALRPIFGFDGVQRILPTAG